MIEQAPKYEKNTEINSSIQKTKQELSKLKENIFLEWIEKKKEDFGNYLQKKGIDIQKFPKASWLGKFLRTFRYYKDIKNIAIEKNIPLNYFFWLKMIEGEGDPSTINTGDWWAGISQIQPDTFKQFGKDNLGKNYKIFSDNPKYKDFSYEKLTKKDGKTREQANAIIANILMNIKKEWWYPALIAIDDRFNPQIAIEFSAEYLLYCKKQVNTKWFTDKSWDVYKNDPKFDFEWMLALNGYNKWPKSFDVDVTWNHLTNLKTRVNQYDLYSERLTELLKKWYTYEDVLNNISLSDPAQRKKIPQTPNIPIPNIFKEIATTEKPTNKGPESKNMENLTYLNKSSDKQWYVYKYTIVSDITNALDLSTLFQAFAWTTFMITDKNGDELSWSDIPSKKWAYFYIKEKIE